MLGGRRDRQALGCNCRSARTARRIPEIIGRQASRPNLRGMEGAHRKGRGVSSVAARGARPQLSGLFARAMRRQRVIGVPRTTTGSHRSIASDTDGMRTASSCGPSLPTGRFADAVRTGERQTVPAIGAEFWDYFAQHPAEGAIFTSAMHGFTSGVAPEVTRLVDTSNVKLTVDVGGASGTLVHSLMAENPNLLGIVFDLPSVMPSAAAAATALGLADRSKAVSGDFFAYVPEADLYLLKFFLHDL